MLNSTSLSKCLTTKLDGALKCHYFNYRNEGKILFSGSIDKTIVQWSSSLEPFHTIEVS